MAGNRKADYIHTAPWVIQAKLGMRDYSTNQVQPRTHTTNRKRDENGEKRHNFRQRHFALYRYIYHILYIFALPFFYQYHQTLTTFGAFCCPLCSITMAGESQLKSFRRQILCQCHFSPLEIHSERKSAPFPAKATAFCPIRTIMPQHR